MKGNTLEEQWKCIVGVRGVRTGGALRGAGCDSNVLLLFHISTLEGTAQSTSAPGHCTA